MPIDVSSFALTNTSLFVPPSVASASIEFSLVLNLRKELFTGGNSYVFRISVVETGVGAVIQDNITVVMNTPPSNGVLEVSPNPGYAVSTIFNISALGWLSISDAYPLSYSFSFQVTQTTLTQQLASNISQSFTLSKLPLGLASLNYTIAILAYVSDSFGASPISQPAP